MYIPKEVFIKNCIESNNIHLYEMKFKTNKQWNYKKTLKYLIFEVVDYRKYSGKKMLRMVGIINAPEVSFYT